MRVVIPYVTVFLFVLLTNGLFIYYKCFSTCRGYLWVAAIRLIPFLAIVFGLQTILGVCLYEFVVPRIYVANFIFQQTTIAGLSGFLVTAFPSGVMEWAVSSYLSRKDVKIKQDLEQPVNRLILKVWVVNRLKAKVQELKSLDNFRAQWQQGWWNFNLSTNSREAEKEAGRRIRRLYEVFKIEIANQQRKAYLLDIAGGYFPGNKFFYLVRFLGRKRLHQLLADPPPPPQPGCDWNGSERRKIQGAKADRKDSEQNSNYWRVGDDEGLRQCVARGDLFR